MLPLQSFAPGVLAAIVRQQPASPARTTFAWGLAVGPALARVSSVDLRGGILKVTTTDIRWTREIMRARAVLLTRLQHTLGAEAVTRIEVNREP
ncbi:MAG TPA: DciA family protein [Vicinamibacterales bacterium]|nr:DciA family protein [Vicinamibacterales bacterium]